MTSPGVHSFDLATHLENLGYSVEHDENGNYEVFHSFDVPDLEMTFTANGDGLVRWVEYWHDFTGWDNDISVNRIMGCSTKDDVISTLNE